MSDHADDNDDDDDVHLYYHTLSFVPLAHRISPCSHIHSANQNRECMLMLDTKGMCVLKHAHVLTNAWLLSTNTKLSKHKTNTATTGADQLHAGLRNKNAHGKIYQAAQKHVVDETAEQTPKVSR